MDGLWVYLRRSLIVRFFDGLGACTRDGSATIAGGIVAAVAAATRTTCARGSGNDIVVALVEGHRRGSHRVVVVGLAVAVAARQRSVCVVAASVRTISSVTIAH